MCCFLRNERWWWWLELRFYRYFTCICTKPCIVFCIVVAVCCSYRCNKRSDKNLKKNVTKTFENVEKIKKNVCKRLRKTLPTFASNPTIIFAHWVICRLSHFNTHLNVSALQQVRYFAVWATWQTKINKNHCYKASPKSIFCRMFAYSYFAFDNFLY